MTFIPGIPASPRRSNVVEFVTTGATFEPQIELAVGSTAQVLWRFSDGSTSNLLEPSVSFGSSGTRIQRLTCSNPSDVRIINIGYDAGDGGWYQIDMWPTQQVAKVRNLKAFPRLTHFAANQCPLQGMLDLSGLPYLIEAEAFVCTGVTAIDLRGSNAIRRLCVEDCNIGGILDLSNLTALEDLRGALNNYQGILWPASGMPALWHMCVRDNLAINRALVPDWSLFPVLRDILHWRTNQSGTLAPHCADGAEVYVGGNSYSAIDFVNSPSVRVNAVVADDNALQSVQWRSTHGQTLIDLRFNALPQAQVDAALLHARDFGGTTIEVRLQGGTNAAPSATGLGYRDTIVARGGTVTVNT